MDGPGHDIIVLGASAGGVEALSEIAASLPSDIPAALFVVLHLSAEGTSVLPQILRRAGSLDARHPVDGERFGPGRFYVAPPDHHLLVEQGYVRVVRGPRENGQRPAVDPLFRSAARAYGGRVVGVVLSGNLDDGVAGLVEIKTRSGITVVQDPDEARHPGMPRNALAYASIDHCVRLADLVRLLPVLARQPVGVPPAVAVPQDIALKPALREIPMSAEDEKKLGIPSAFTCPECNGTLWELHEGELLQFSCRVGHTFSAESAMAAQSDALERALWTALRSLEENVALTRRMARHARDRRAQRTADRFERRADDTEQHVHALRRALAQGVMGGTGPLPAEATGSGD